MPLSNDAYANEPTTPSVKRGSLTLAVEQAVQKLLKRSPQARVTHRISQIGPSLILKMSLPLVGETPQAQATSFVHDFNQLWGNISVSIAKVETRRGRSVITLKGEINGLPILGQLAKLSIKDGRAQHLSNGLGALSIVHPALISEDQARKSVTRHIQAVDRSAQAIKLLRGVISHSPGEGFEVFEARVADPTRLRSWIILVDGRDGQIIQTREGEVH